MTIKLVTFDLDETLWAVEEPIRRADKAQWAWLKQHRERSLALQDPATLNEIRKEVWSEHAHESHDVSLMRRLFLGALLRRAGYSGEEAEEGAVEAFRVFLKERQQVQLFDGVLDSLRALSQNFRLAALTNGNADIFKTEAAALFEFALRAEEVGAKKPDPAIFHAALERSQLSPQEVMHVGDHPRDDVHGAQAVGIAAIWINPGNNSWAEGPAPAATVTSVCELPELLRTSQAAS
ncbi:MAG: HAD family hydrolase [Pseudomonadota bacterium]